MKYSPLLPTGWFLSCVVAGTTSAGEIVLPSPVVENANVVDGTVTWTVRKIGSGGGEAVGVIKQFAGNGAIPAGYLLCDGAAVSRTMYPDLFAAIGTTYGAGDGSTTFNLPNLVGKFAEGAETAGTQKEPGLPNITGSVSVAIANNAAATNTIALQSRDYSGAFDKQISGVAGSYFSSTGNITSSNNRGISIDASLSNPIYGNSDTVQPNALTVRYIIKAFDGQTADSALIDITQYAQRLEQKADINGSNLVYHKDVITTSGTYTAPVTGLYKITVKGGGGGGQGGFGASNNTAYGVAGGCGGEGGTTIGYEKMIVGDTAAVVIGAGGTGGNSLAAPAGAGAVGANGGSSSVTVNNNTYTGGGGDGGTIKGGSGGTGTIPGTHGESENVVVWVTTGFVSQYASPTGKGYGSGGAGGEAGVGSRVTPQNGSPGTNGVVWFEYYTPGA